MVEPQKPLNGPDKGSDARYKPGEATCYINVVKKKNYQNRKGIISIPQIIRLIKILFR